MSEAPVTCEAPQFDGEADYARANDIAPLVMTSYNISQQEASQGTMVNVAMIKKIC